MTEEQTQTVEVEELEADLDGLRLRVLDAFDAFVEVYDQADAEFRPIAHQVRVAGRKVKGMSPKWLARSVHYRKRGESSRFPVQ